MSTILSHPYSPPSIVLRDYRANDWTVPQLLAIFSGTCAVVLGLTHVAVGYVNRQLSKGDRALILWFVLSGSIHFWFEGYWVINHTRIPSQQDLFGQLWKEYALSDSRYLTSEAIVMCIETVTAIFWGPGCYLAAYLIVANSPWRHPVQFLVSMGQFYGDALYYATNIFNEFYNGWRVSRPEMHYYWGYWFFMNSFWIVLPGWCIYESIMASVAAFKKAATPIGNGYANGYANGSATKKRI